MSTVSRKDETEACVLVLVCTAFCRDNTCYVEKNGKRLRLSVFKHKQENQQQNILLERDSFLTTSAGRYRLLHGNNQDELMMRKMSLGDEN